MREIIGVAHDMFWTTFVVLGDDARLFDATLWQAERFAYRHAISGRAPRYSIVGAMRPTRADPFVYLRGLY